MSRPIDLILPDAGPLISLAHADRLDLLDVFSRPIIVLDVVRSECLRKPGTPDHPRLSAWFARAGNRVLIVDTPIGPVFEEARQREASGKDAVATRGLGDAALSWALQNLDRLSHADAVPLVLVEDRRLAVRLQGLDRGHVLSTRAWLAALDEAGVADYRAVVRDMARHGRDMARHGRDLSALAVDALVGVDSDRSEWLGTIINDGGRSG